MHGTQKPLTIWFKAMWWFTTRKSGVNTVNLKCLLGLGAIRPSGHGCTRFEGVPSVKAVKPFRAMIEVDELVVGGQKPGKRGRGAIGKTIGFVAVEKQGHKFGRIRLQDEYVFRFNRRTSRNIGKKVMRIAQQIILSTKVIYSQIVVGVSPFCLLAN